MVTNYRHQRIKVNDIAEKRQVDLTKRTKIGGGPNLRCGVVLDPAAETERAIPRQIPRVRVHRRECYTPASVVERQIRNGIGRGLISRAQINKS